ncbi:hypothetical protein HT136_10775 [Novosphingobium profundi]|uniref:hypothetical protein n=1 Tax=Novosphingobium profundi TaxID=1774954 RepID=UPI001BDAF8A4|nr:hypothetical protein [Novosphingobium profundi]MBT0668849.1 hypothetical protein [Novosphingobium profundi]
MRHFRSTAALAVLLLGFGLLPTQVVHAQPATSESPRVRYGGFDPVARDAWLADCHQKVAARDSSPSARPVGRVPTDECQAYLDAFYERYTHAGYAGYHPQTGAIISGYDPRRYGADYTHASEPGGSAGLKFVSHEVVQRLPAHAAASGARD